MLPGGMELTEHQKRPPEDSVTRIIQTNNATLIPFWGGKREKRQKQEGRREREREKDGERERDGVFQPIRLPSCIEVSQSILLSDIKVTLVDCVVSVFVYK